MMCFKEMKGQIKKHKKLSLFITLFLLLAVFSVCFKSFSYRLSLLQPVFILVTAYVAILGINAWRKELVGRRKLELAEEAVDVFCKLPNAFYRIRLPLIFLGEIASRPKSKDETEALARDLDLIYVIQERINREQAIFDKFQNVKFRFLLYFNDNGAACFSKAEDILKEMLLALTVLTQMAGDEYPEKKEHIATLRYLEPDATQKTFEEIRDEMLSICKPLLK